MPSTTATEVTVYIWVGWDTSLAAFEISRELSSAGGHQLRHQLGPPRPIVPPPGRFRVRVETPAWRLTVGIADLVSSSG